jgi:hypothetical protein
MPSYLHHRNGTIELVEEPTRSHPDGDAPRLADGAVVGPDGLALPLPADQPAPAPAAPPEPEPEPTADTAPEPDPAEEP